MRRMMRLAVTVTALGSLLGVLSSSAEAVHWHATGAANFHTTGGNVTIIPHGGGAAVMCLGSTASGSVTTTGSNPVFELFHGTVTYNNCVTFGVPVALECGLTFTADAWAPGPPAVTSGSLDLTCGLSMGNTKICHISGTSPAHYTNPTAHTAGNTGKLTLTKSTESVATGVNCPMGNNVKLIWPHETWNFTGATGPKVERTA